MLHMDERIRSEMAGIHRPVADEGVLEMIAARRGRIRFMRRARTTTVAVAVLGSTVTGMVVLTKAFGGGMVEAPGAGAPSPPPATPTERIIAGTGTLSSVCDVSSLTADLNGDGRPDTVDVYSLAESCDSPSVGNAYEAYVEIAAGASSGGATYTQPLPACEQPYACQVFSGPDVDRDGRAEVAITTIEGASTEGFALYRFEPQSASGPALARLEIAELGDPWDPVFGLGPGPAIFGWYGSVTHLQWLSCDGPPGGFVALTALRDEDDSHLYRLHGTVLRLAGTSLQVDSTWDRTIRESELEIPETICGARILRAE